MTDPPKMPTHDLLGKLITQLDQLLALQEGGNGQPGAATATATPDFTAVDGLDAYLARRIEAALAPLRALVHERDVSYLRSLLKERLATDPHLSGLVQRLANAAVHRLRP